MVERKQTGSAKISLKGLNMITIGDIKHSLRPTLGKIKMFRPTCGDSFIEIEGALLNKAFDEIADKIPFVEAGICEFTAGETLLFMLFTEHAKFGG